MIYIMLLLFAVALFLSLKYYITKMSVLLFSMVMSIVGLVFSALLFIAKTDKYNYFYNQITAFDYHVFLKISSLSISHNQITTLTNISLMLYFATMLIFNYQYYRSVMVPHRKIVARYVRYAFSIVWYIIFYNPKVSLWIYILTNAEKYQEFHLLIKYLVYILDIVNYIILAHFSLIPILTAIKCYKSAFSQYKKMQIMSITFCLTVLNIFCISLLLFLPFRRPYILQPPEAILGITLTNRISSRIFIVCSLLYPMAILSFIYAIVHYNLIPASNLFKSSSTRKSVYRMNKNLIDAFHMFKNIVFEYKISVSYALNSKTPEECKSILQDLDKQMTKFINTATKAMSINNSIDIELCKFDILSLLDETLKLVDTKKITVCKNYLESQMEFIGDSFYMRDVFANIIKNAVEAINDAQRENGEITVTALYEYEWIIIQISDNGVGINKQDLKKIFEPIFTTKSSNTNWGVGLSFVNKIIKVHRGQIHIRSEENKGTDVTILLPKNLKEI